MALNEMQRELYKRWDKLEQILLTNKRLSKKVLKDLEKAYQDDVTEQEQETIINNVYNQFYNGNTEVKNG